MDHNDPQVIATRAGEALYARSHPEHQLSEPARAYAHMTMLDVSRDSLRRSGVNTSGMSPETIITRSLGGLHTTSDFPLILGDFVNREMRTRYNSAPSAVRQVAKQSSSRDFRAKHKLMLGGFSDLEKVNEAGEFKSGTINEAGETYRLHRAGRILGVSYQAMVNDDLGAFTGIPAEMSTSALSYQFDTLVNMILSNPAMSDGNAVFSAAHGNITGAYAFNTLTLSAARTAMRRQKGLGGMLIDVTPRYLLVPPELETDGEKLIVEISATTTDDVNPFSKLTLLVEPRLTDPEQYYIVANPATVDGLEYAYLEGAPGPQIETRAGFEVDGIQFKISLNFGAGWIDHRGWYRVG